MIRSKNPKELRLDYHTMFLNLCREQGNPESLKFLETFLKREFKGIYLHQSRCEFDARQNELVIGYSQRMTYIRKKEPEKKYFYWSFFFKDRQLIKITKDDKELYYEQNS